MQDTPWVEGTGRCRREMLRSKLIKLLKKQKKRIKGRQGEGKKKKKMCSFGYKKLG